jgi:hypothetical protein
MLEVPRMAGYDYGKVDRSPVTLEELRQLKATVGFTPEDEKALRRMGDVLAQDAEALVDDWRKIIGAQEHLAHWFVGPDGKPDDRYKSAIKPRFVQWVRDMFERPFDQAWLDYQEEIGLRHTREKKNKTDGAATPPLVPLRYLLAFAAPVLDIARKRLHEKKLFADDIDTMHAAWTKAVILTLVLWSRPYAQPGLW